MLNNLNNLSQEKPRHCPHCNSTQIEEEGEKLVCEKCGVVIEDSVISSEQQGIYSYEDVVKKGRHGFTSYYPESRTARRNLKMVQSLINDLVNKLHLPHFIGNDALKRYKQLIQEKTVRKDILKSTAAALIFLTCRKARIPIPLKRIVRESDASKKGIVKRYQEIIEILKIEMSPPSIEGLTLGIAKRVDLSPKGIALARKIAKNMKKDIYFVGKDPNGIAAAAVYIAAKRENKTLTQEEIAEIASITTITLRNQLESLPSLSS